MPGRKFPLVTNYYYHIYNRGNDLRPTFTTVLEYRRFMSLLEYYRFQNYPFAFSRFRDLSQKRRNEILNELKETNQTYIDVIAYCLMPNHFHLLVKQNIERGISNFIRKVQNGYTKYFNIKRNRTGTLFQGSFKSVLVESETQLMHLSRYIHLNPYSGAIVKNRNNLTNYPWSSLLEYISKKQGPCSKEIILTNFKNKQEYKKFVWDQADYQKKLQQIKHLALEKELI